MVGDYGKILCKAREKHPGTLEPATLQGPISPSGGEKKARGDETWGRERQGASPCPGSLPAPQPGDRRDDPCKTGCGIAEAPLARPETPLLPEDSPAPDSGLLGLLGDVQYMCRWKSGKAEDFINVKQEK